MSRLSVLLRRKGPGYSPVTAPDGIEAGDATAGFTIAWPTLLKATVMNCRVVGSVQGLLDVNPSPNPSGVLANFMQLILDTGGFALGETYTFHYDSGDLKDYNGLAIRPFAAPVQVMSAPLVALANVGDDSSLSVELDRLCEWVGLAPHVVVSVNGVPVGVAAVGDAVPGSGNNIIGITLSGAFISPGDLVHVDYDGGGTVPVRGFFDYSQLGPFSTDVNNPL